MTDTRMMASALAMTKLSAREKGKKGARAKHAADRMRRAAEDAKEQSLGGRAKSKMKAKSVRVEDVPPFSYLAAGRTPEEAAIEVIKHFCLKPAEALGLVWKLRQIIADDAAYIAAAEVPSARNTAARPIPSELSTSIISTTHKTTPKATAYAGGYVKLLAAKLFPVMLSILKTYNDWVSTVKNGGAGAVSDAFRMAAAFAETLWDWIMRVASGVKSAFSKLNEFKIVVWAAGVAVAALIAYQAGVFFTTLGGAVMTAASALFTLNASGALTAILVGGLVIAIALLIDELVNFYEGNETIIGQLNEEYPGAI